MQETISGGQGQGEGATLIVRASPSSPGWLFTLSRCDVPPPLLHPLTQPLLHGDLGTITRGKSVKSQAGRTSHHVRQLAISTLVNTWSLRSPRPLTHDTAESSWRLCDRSISCYLALLKIQSHFESGLYQGNHFGCLSLKICILYS